MKKKKNAKAIRLSWLATALLALALLCLFLGVWHAWDGLRERYRPITYRFSPSAEAARPLDGNPFRGFCHLYGITLSEEDPKAIADRVQQYVGSGSLPLMMLQVNLKNYANEDLSENALEQLDAALSEISRAKRQAILRFLYDWDGHALETEPRNKAQILSHMEQVGPIVSRHASSVFLLQGTFTGNCGEMTQTAFGSHEDNRALMSHLAQVTDPSIFLAVRTPSQLRGVLQTKETVTEETAFDGSLGSRLGLFNDGMLGSVYDLGTYDDTPNEGSPQPEDKGTREEELAFQEKICQFVPNGGEAVLPNPYNDLENAVEDLSRMRVTYLSCDHDAAVMEKWKASVYHGEGSFDGCNGYDYIAAHLGYRYVVTGAKLSYDALDADSGSLAITIRNTGFAPAYRLFEATLTLRKKTLPADEGGHATEPADAWPADTLAIPLDMDNRAIGGGTERTFSIPLALGGLAEGAYEIRLSLRDPSTGNAICFANEDTYADGSARLGTLTAEPFSREGLLSCLREHWRSR